MNKEIKNSQVTFLDNFAVIYHLFYDPANYQVFVRDLFPVATIHRHIPKAHRYGKLFASAPELYLACKRAFGSQKTLIYLLNQKFPQWKNHYTFDITLAQLKQTLEQLESDAG